MMTASLSHGLADAPYAIEAVRIGLRASLGAFFAFSGYHKIFAPSRRATLAATFKADGVYNPAMMWAIPLGELFGGLALALGVLTPLACVGLIAICLGACALDGRKRVADWKPLDAADRVDDWLYLPEALYVLMLAALALLGAGSFSIDAIVASLF